MLAKKHWWSLWCCQNLLNCWKHCMDVIEMIWKTWCSFGTYFSWASSSLIRLRSYHDDVIKWKHFPRNWPFVREIHRSPVNFPHKGQWGGALIFSLIYTWINDWVNNHEAGDLRRQHGHYDVIVMQFSHIPPQCIANSWPNSSMHFVTETRYNKGNILHDRVDIDICAVP